MRFHFRDGVIGTKKSAGRPFLFAIPAIGLVVGAYVLITAFSPAAINMPVLQQGEPTKDKLIAAPGEYGNRLYIPQINVDVAIVEGEDQSVLEQGAWHRKVANGNPEIGGNFVLSAHRFSMGFTPQQTREQSPFYNIHKLEVGQQIFVDYNGERYGYEVIEKDSVQPDQAEIEAPSIEPKLTLYSSTLGGVADGRDVVIAKPLGKVKELSANSL